MIAPSSIDMLSDAGLADPYPYYTALFDLGAAVPSHAYFLGRYRDNPTTSPAVLRDGPCA